MLAGHGWCAVETLRYVQQTKNLHQKQWDEGWQSECMYCEACLLENFCLGHGITSEQNENCQMIHVGLACHSCSNSNLLRIAWKLWMVLGLLDVGMVA